MKLNPFKLNPFTSRPLIGLDIQPYEIRLAQLRHMKSGFLVEQAAITRLPDGVFNEGRIKRWEVVQEKLTETVRQLDIAGMMTAILLPASLVRMQQIQIPYGLPEAAIEAEIKVQLERDFPGFTDSLLMDFHVANAEESGYADVFFVVTRQEYVSQYVDCINAAGLSVKIVDVDVHALKRVFTGVLPLTNKTQEVHALVCHVNRVVTFIIFTHSEIIFHHQWEINADNEFLPQLKIRIHLFVTTFPGRKLRKISIYSHDQHVRQCINNTELNQEFDIDYPDPLDSIKLNHKNTQHIHAENISDFLLACGAAMCGVPRW